MTDSAIRFDEPLYDAAAPIACTIGGGRASRPHHAHRAAAPQLQSIERTPYGVLLTLPGTAENAADLRRVAVEEKQCCLFWGFEVIEQPDLVLRWDGPPELGDYMDRLVDYFEGRAPIGGLFGSL